MYKLIRTYQNIVLLGFELCFNLVLVHKDLEEHFFVRILNFGLTFFFEGRTKPSNGGRKKNKVGEEKKNLGE